jgi:hypothetical protein
MQAVLAHAQCLAPTAGCAVQDDTRSFGMKDDTLKKILAEQFPQIKAKLPDVSGHGAANFPSEVQKVWSSTHAYMQQVQCKCVCCCCTGHVRLSKALAPCELAKCLRCIVAACWRCRPSKGK